MVSATIIWTSRSRSVSWVRERSGSYTMRTAKDFNGPLHERKGKSLKRAFFPESGAAATVTTYINGFVYQETATLTPTSTAPFAGTGVGLSYITYEEGRIRVMTAISQGNGLDGLTANG